ncbi:MAG: T9SS type A sorting domain-containing protein, partial [Bacteroidales bacterium]|nr:T9SS type A sorting domain-containing protein [Bacteroidales bacterium]
TMLATLDASRYTMTEGNYEIGAFVGDECRGSARLQRVGSQYIAYLSVSGEEGETVRFKLYDVTNNVEQGLAEEQVSYVSNAITGTTHEPVVLHFRGTTDVNEQASQVRVFPNPADEWITIESEALQSATLFTLTGQQLLHEPIQSGSTRLNVSALAPGLYLLQLRSTDGSTLTRKIEIK